jgi:hypothetical protein
VTDRVTDGACHTTHRRGSSGTARTSFSTAMTTISAVPFTGAGATAGRSPRWCRCVLHVHARLHVHVCVCVCLWLGDHGAGGACVCACARVRCCSATRGPFHCVDCNPTCGPKPPRGLQPTTRLLYHLPTVLHAHISVVLRLDDGGVTAHWWCWCGIWQALRFVKSESQLAVYKSLYLKLCAKLKVLQVSAPFFILIRAHVAVAR